MPLLLALVVTSQFSAQPPRQRANEAFAAVPLPGEQLADHRLLEPMTPESALWSSLSATLTGLALEVGFGVLTATGSESRLPFPLKILGLSLGFLLMDFGPSVADLLHGNVLRFLGRGLMRLAILALPLIGLVGGPALLAVGFVLSSLTWIGLVVYDVADSQNAPRRWRAGVQASGPGEPADPPEARATGPAYALGVRF